MPDTPSHRYRNWPKIARKYEKNRFVAAALALHQKDPTEEDKLYKNYMSYYTYELLAIPWTLFRKLTLLGMTSSEILGPAVKEFSDDPEETRMVQVMPDELKGWLEIGLGTVVPFEGEDWVVVAIGKNKQAVDIVPVRYVNLNA